MYRYLLIVLFFPLSLLAEDFEVDGVFYKITNTAKLQVEVTYEGPYDEMEPNYFGDVVIPSSVTFNNTAYTVIGIGADCFTDCAKMTSISLPYGLEYLGDYAFDGCVGLSELNLPTTITRIADSAFAGCSGLKYLFIPGVKYIRYGTFVGCSGLEILLFGAGIKEFDPAAFGMHPSLKDIVFYNVTPPEFYGNRLCVEESVIIHVPKGCVDSYKAALKGCENIIIDDADSFASIDHINSDVNSNPPIYFNINGIKSSNPSNGLYIKLDGKKITKVLL